MKKTFGAYYLIFAIILLVSSCNNGIKITGTSDETPVIYPDYADVTVPYNIAPLCFSAEGVGESAVIIRGGSDSIVILSDNGDFNPPADEWREMLLKEKGKTLTVTVCRHSDDGWTAMRPFPIYVSADAIDPYLVYRRITPGYGLWNKMGLYQRCLEDFEETAIHDNREGRGNCINCHSFCEGNAQKWQTHIRAKYAGTYIFDGDKQTKLQLKDTSKGKPSYVNWHPNGKLIAYSNNKTSFLIHTNHPNRWEVMDDGSDVFIADINTGDQYRCEAISSPDRFETFPSFSPDGKWLYFCSAEAKPNAAAAYDSIRYSICRIAFDAEQHTFGSKTDTIYNAMTQGGSASFPRISPDGRWLCFTLSEYGNFSICHRDADLYLIDLQNGNKLTRLDAANDSKNVDSFHSWSRNSRWLVFSSKRDNSIYTKPYFTHIDTGGKPSKPFVLPQQNAKNTYDLEMDCYNLPELVDGKITVGKIELKK
ncbi:MAG: PD40 domain-containing protein [Bacteroidaceae bacterium]|nr:PD40 domain-containing protein [Bacteroidaceae bacterium]